MIRQNVLEQKRDRISPFFQFRYYLVNEICGENNVFLADQIVAFCKEASREYKQLPEKFRDQLNISYHTEQYRIDGEFKVHIRQLAQAIVKRIIPPNNKKQVETYSQHHSINMHDEKSSEDQQRNSNQDSCDSQGQPVNIGRPGTRSKSKSRLAQQSVQLSPKAKEKTKAAKKKRKRRK